MPDKLTIEVNAAVAQALAGLQEVASAVAKLQAVTVQANAAGVASANVHESAIKNLWMAYRTAPSAGAFMKDLGAITTGVGQTLAGGLSSAVTAAGGKIQTHLVIGVKSAISSLNSLDQTLWAVGASIIKNIGPLMGIGAGLAVGFGIEQAISKTMQWDAEIAKLSRELNGNVREASKWAALASFIGIEASQLAIGFQRLSVAIIGHSQDLKGMGVAVVDASGHMRQMTDVLADLQKWFRAHNNTIEANTAATKLFGRGNAEMAALMGMTTGQLRAMTEEAKQLGLIIGGEQLARWRSLDAEVRTAGFSINALMLALGHGLMPIFSVLAQAIAQFVAHNLGGLIKGLANVTGFIIGMMSELFGIKFKFSEFAASIADVSSRVAELGTVNDLAGASANNLAAATRAATDAINAQIDAVRKSNKELQDKIDKEIAALEAQGRQQAYDDQKKQSSQKLANDQKNIDKLRSDYQKYLLLGDLYNAQQVYDQIVSAQEGMANDQESLDRMVADHARQAQIDALKATKKHHDDVTNDLIASLQKRAAAIAASASASNASFLAGSASTAKGFNNQWNMAGQEFTKGISEASVKTGAIVVDNMKASMQIVIDLLNPTNDPKVVARRAALWKAAGDAMGKALIEGMAKALWDWATGPFIDAWKDVMNQHWQASGTHGGRGGYAPPPPPSPATGTVGKSNATGGSNPETKAVGGTISGTPGEPKIIEAHAGERVLTAEQQRQPRVAAALAGMPASPGVAPQPAVQQLAMPFMPQPPALRAPVAPQAGIAPTAPQAGVAPVAPTAPVAAVAPVAPSPTPTVVVQVAVPPSPLLAALNQGIVGLTASLTRTFAPVVQPAVAPKLPEPAKSPEPSKPPEPARPVASAPPTPGSPEPVRAVSVAPGAPQAQPARPVVPAPAPAAPTVVPPSVQPQPQVVVFPAQLTVFGDALGKVVTGLTATIREQTAQMKVPQPAAQLPPNFERAVLDVRKFLATITPASPAAVVVQQRAPEPTQPQRPQPAQAAPVTNNVGPFHIVEAANGQETARIVSQVVLKALGRK